MRNGLRLQGLIGLAITAVLFGGCLSSSGEDDDGAFEVSSEDAVRAARDPIAGDVAVKLDSVTSQYPAEMRLAVKVRFTNNAAYPVRMLGWEALTNTVDDDLFAVTRDGEAIAYMGRDYRRRAPTFSDYVTLAPGRSVTRTVDLTDAYDFTQDGTYSIRYMAQLSGMGEVDTAMVESNELSVRVDGRPNAFLAERQAIERASLTTPSCSSEQTAIIKKAIADATMFANNSVSYLSGNPSNKMRYTTWFGAYNATRWNTTRKNFSAIRTALTSANIQAMCDCHDASLWAWVYKNQPYKIHLCPAMWETGTNYQDDRATNFIHELSHFDVVASTDDATYGPSSCKSLAKRNPAKAVDNADTYAYFAENAESY